VITPNTTKHTSTRRRRGGFTLVELILAMTITALIGGAVSAMFTTVSQGTTSEAGRRSANARKTILRARLNAALRSTRLTLAEGQHLDTGANFLLLWTGDSTYNDLPNVSELLLLQHNPRTGQITAYRAIDTLPLADDKAIPLSTNFETLAAAMPGHAYFPSELWANSVSGWDIQLDNATPLNATSATYAISVTHDDYTADFSGNVAFRSR
jgi:prepilin-type N-terminal cleavage/methylation domain-containing protein